MRVSTTLFFIALALLFVVFFLWGQLNQRNLENGLLEDSIEALEYGERVYQKKLNDSTRVWVTKYQRLEVKNKYLRKSRDTLIHKMVELAEELDIKRRNIIGLRRQVAIYQDQIKVVPETVLIQQPFPMDSLFIDSPKIVLTVVEEYEDEWNHIKRTKPISSDTAMWDISIEVPIETIIAEEKIHCKKYWWGFRWFICLFEEPVVTTTVVSKNPKAKIIENKEIHIND